MAVLLSPVGGAAAQFLDNNGNPLLAGKLFTYVAGTTTNQATYTSSSGVTPHTNPIILDAGGRVPGGEIWLTDGLQYKFVLKNANDVLIGTYDNLVGINSNFVNFLTETEVQTATAGQTVFTLTTMQYQPSTNNLTVYVDGVNQIDGATYSYVETSSTVVTFTAGLHVGALVKFTTAQTLSTGVTDASLVTYTPPFTASVATTVENKLAQTVSVLDFGAVGDGVADDTVAIQAAINHIRTSTTEKCLYIPTGVYKLTDTLSARNLASFNGGNYKIYGDGISSVLYQTGAGKDVLVIGSFSTGAVTTDIQEGVTLSGFSMVGTTGTSKGLYVNSVARSFFENLYIVADEYALFLEGCLINSWDGIKLSYANFNENPIAGVTMPTTREYGLYVAPSNQAYTTNVWNSLVIEGNSIWGGYVEGGSTNTYNNLVCEGHTGAGFFSQSEWDVFNGIYVEAITGTALTLQNTQKISIISLFTNTESVVLSNCLATIINSRADWTLGETSGGVTFINSDGTLTYLAGSNNGTDLRLINSSLFDLTHKVQLGNGFGMAGGNTSSFSAVAPRALVDRVSYTQTPSVLASYGDKVWFSQGNVSGNLGAKPGGYAGLIVSNRVETTLSSAIGNGATTIPVVSVTGMRLGDVLAVRNTANNGYAFGTINSFGAGPVVGISGAGVTGGAPLGYEVFAIRWDLFGDTCGFDALNSASATPTVGSGGRNFTLADSGFNITNFTGGLIGQEIRLFPNVGGTITNGATVQLAGGVNFSMAAGDSLTLIKKPDGVWYEVSRSVN